VIELDIKIVIGDPETKQTYTKVISSSKISGLLGKKIGDTFPGEIIGLQGYEFKITGGSDRDGFPMRKDLNGSMRKRIMITKSIGLREKEKGLRRRKLLCGNTITERIVQINTKVIKKGNIELSTLKRKK
jgi:small subunit ribosomal protein S6e